MVNVQNVAEQQQQPQQQLPADIQQRMNAILARQNQRNQAAPQQIEQLQQVAQNIQINQQAIQNQQQQNQRAFAELSARSRIENISTAVATLTTNADSRTATQPRMNARRNLEGYLRSRIARRLYIISQFTEPRHGEVARMQLYQHEYSYELANSLYHGSRFLFFRWFRGPVSEENNMDKVISGAKNTANGILARQPSMKQPHYTPEQVTEINNLVDESITYICGTHGIS